MKISILIPTLDTPKPVCTSIATITDILTNKRPGFRVEDGYVTGFCWVE